MNRYSIWHYLLLAALIIFGIIYTLPNLYGEDPALQITTKDLSVLTPETQTQVQTILKDSHISPLSQQLTNKVLLIRFKDTDDQLKAEDRIESALGNNFVVALNLATRTPKWLLAFGAEPMKLGLDLRGGIHFLLDVDTKALAKAQMTGDISAMTTELRKERIRYTDIGTENQNMIVHFRDADAANQALILLKKDFYEYEFEKHDATITGQLTKAAVHQIQQTAIDQITLILQKRVNELGVAEPVIQQQGANQISLDLPGIQDTARAKDVIGKVATVRFQLQDIEHDAEVAKRTGMIPIGSKLYTFENQPVLIKNQVILRGTSIANASSMIGDNGRPAVQIRITGNEVNSFNRITGAHVGKPLATIYVETEAVKEKVGNEWITTHKQVERIISIASINSALGNNFQIFNLNSMDYAKELALLLRSGAYPVPVDFVQERVVGPSLGKENIHMGVMSTVAGSLLVIVFMALYYRLFGIIADLAVVLNVLLLIATLSLIGATLTLPGIAGIVLTVGMAVDANVLINERIREELRNGLTPQASIKIGYDRAFATIIDAHVTALIVMVILFALGSGAVQGFAVTTTIGLLYSMITAIFCTRAIVNWIYGRRNVKHLSVGIKVS